MQKKYLLFIPLLFFFQTYFAQCDSSLVLDIPFDLGGIDKSLYQHHGTLSATLSSNRSTDRFGDSATFRWDTLASSIIIENYDEDALKPDLPITFATWIYLDSLNRSQGVFTNEDRPNAYSGIFLSITQNNEFAASLGFGPIGPPGRRSAITTRTLTTGQWYFLTAVYNTGNVIDLYIDGKKEAVTTSGTGAGIDYYGSVYSPSIGKYLTQNLWGKLDNLKMWNRALDETEINDLYLSEKYEKNLVVHRTFSGNDADISSYQQANLTINSTGKIVDTTNQLGMPQSAYYFNDSTQLISPTTSTLSPLNVEFPFSFSAWITTDDSSLTFNTVYTNNDLNTRYTGFWLQLNNGKPIISVGNNGSPGPSGRRSTQSDSVLRSNQWYQIVCVAKSIDSTLIYVDTVSTAVSQTGTGNTINYIANSGYESVGGMNKGNSTIRYYKGKIGDIKLWNDSISEDFIKYLYRTNVEKFNLFSTDTVFACVDDSLTLSLNNVSSSYNFSWSTGSKTTEEKIALDSSERRIICISGDDGQGNLINDRIVVDVLQPADTAITINVDTLIAQDSLASYQWLDCNNNFAPIPGATQQKFSPTSQGSYAVELTTMNLCKDTSACVMVNLTSLSKNQSPLESITLYPNPASDQLFIKNKESNDLSITLFDQVGKVVFLQDSWTSQPISLSSFKNGIYWVELRNATDIAYKKFVIAR